MSRRVVIRALPLGLACALVMVACDRVEADADPAEELAAETAAVDPAVIAALPEGITAEMVAEGREHYVVCSVCHGMEGEGTQLGPPLRDGDRVHGDGSLASIEAIIREGVRSPAEYPVPMPEMGGGLFTSEELRALSAYVHALGYGAR